MLGVTSHPKNARVTQQSRNLLMNPDRQRDTVKFLLHDRNGKCTAAWNAVLPGASITIGARSGSSVVIGRSISSTNTHTQHDADQILGTHTSDLAPAHFGAIPASSMPKVTILRECDYRRMRARSCCPQSRSRHPG